MSLKELNSKTAIKRICRERVIQFGEGNFLRGFVEWIIYEMNRKIGFDTSVVMTPGTSNPKSLERLKKQDWLYHINLQGFQGGENIDTVTIIDSISRGVSPFTQFEEFLKLAEIPDMRFIISNTTEAGIAFDSSCSFSDRPASSFPGRLTQLLFHRYVTFKGDSERGFIILPCELIYKNGRCLSECVNSYIDLWKEDMGDQYEGFKSWFNNHCFVCNTLVDRIVPGFPEAKAEEINRKTGFEDKAIVQGEIFHLWVIECPSNMTLRKLKNEFPAEHAGLNVLITGDESPYHARKVTLLNAPHTLLAPVALMSGKDFVRDACEDDLLSRYVRTVQVEELLPTVNLPQKELESFAHDIMERFMNPYIDHNLNSIMLNAFPKYKARVIPALLRYVEKYDKLPVGMVFGLAALIHFYKPSVEASSTESQPRDNVSIIEFFNEVWKSDNFDYIAREVLGAKELIWEEHGDLNNISGLSLLLSTFLSLIEKDGMKGALITVLNNRF